MEFRKGALVKVKPEWLDKGERDVPYIVLEDRGDRVLVQELREYSNQPILGSWCWPKETMYLIDNDTADKAFDKELFDDIAMEQREQM